MKQGEGELDQPQVELEVISGVEVEVQLLFRMGGKVGQEKMKLMLPKLKL